MAYQRFNRANDIVENQRTTISSGLWSGGSSELTAFYTQSTNGNITGSFLELYNEDPNLSSSAEVQFAVGYAHLEGSGSKGNTTKLTDGGRQTAALYRQFRNVLLAPNTDRFEFTSSPSASGDKDFYFCGRTALEGAVYCSLHFLIAFQSKNEKEEEKITEEDIPSFLEKKIKSA